MLERIEMCPGCYLPSGRHNWGPKSRSDAQGCKLLVSIENHGKQGRGLTVDGWVMTRNIFPAMAGSIPVNIPPATWNVRVSVDVRTKISFSLTDFRKPNFVA